MMLRRLWIATQFLTRLPTPPVRDYSSRELSRSASWFPLVGLVVGALVALIVLAFREVSVPLAAASGVILWVVITGALHLDGLADLTDALAASHRDPRKFFTVLKDPHIGTFGTVSIVLALLVKYAALLELQTAALAVLPLVAAWARLGPLAWSSWLRPLTPGHAEQFSWEISLAPIVIWTALLLAASVLLAPCLCLAVAFLFAWGVWLRIRLGGVTGDCLGAGVEGTECALLMGLVVWENAGSLLPRLI